MDLQVGDRLTERDLEWEIVGRPYTSNAGWCVLVCRSTVRIAYPCILARRHTRRAAALARKISSGGTGRVARRLDGYETATSHLE